MDQKTRHVRSQSTNVDDGRLRGTPEEEVINPVTKKQGTNGQQPKDTQSRGNGFRGRSSNRGRGGGYSRGGQTRKPGHNHPEAASSLQAIADNYEGTPRNSSNMIVEFIADSGATEHLSNSRMYFTEYTDNVKSKIDCANKSSSFETEGLGKTEIVTKDHNTFTLNNILYANELSNNLLSLRRFVDQGLEVYLNNKVIDVFDPKLNKSIISGDYNKPFWTLKLVVDNNSSAETKLTSKNKSFYNTRSKKNLEVSETVEKVEETKVDSKSNKKLKELAKSGRKDNNEFLETAKNRKTHEVDNKTDLEIDNDLKTNSINDKMNNIISEAMLWHIRLGHVSKTYLIALAKKNGKLMNLNKIVSDNSISECKACLEANSTKLPFTKLHDRATIPL